MNKCNAYTPQCTIAEVLVVRLNPQIVWVRGSSQRAFCSESDATNAVSATDSRPKGQ